MSMNFGRETLYNECVEWLRSIRVLSPKDDIEDPKDLLHALYDGQLLCQVLKTFDPEAVDLNRLKIYKKKVAFLCVRNLEIFLTACQKSFGLDESDLFQPLDLINGTNFLAVLQTLSIISKTKLVSQLGFSGFPNFDTEENESEYINKITESKYYDYLDDVVHIEEDTSQYEYLELKDGEDNEMQDFHNVHGKDTIDEMIKKEEVLQSYLMILANNVAQELEHYLTKSSVKRLLPYIDILSKLHSNLYQEMLKAIEQTDQALGIAEVFINFSRDFSAYGLYSYAVEKVEAALKDELKSNANLKTSIKIIEDKLLEGQTLHTALMKPIFRLPKYILLLQNLIKEEVRKHYPGKKSYYHTSDSAPKSIGMLEKALLQIRDVVQYVNDVISHCEAMDVTKRIMERLEYPKGKNHLEPEYIGKYQMDGNLIIISSKNETPTKRTVILFDKLLLITPIPEQKRNVRPEEIIYLNNAMSVKKAVMNYDPSYLASARKLHGWVLVNKHKQDVVFYSKHKEQARRWKEQVQKTILATAPKTKNHKFIQYTFQELSECHNCNRILKGIIYQGYKCSECDTNVDADCLDNDLPCCAKVPVLEPPSSLRKRLSVSLTSSPSSIKLPTTPLPFPAKSPKATESEKHIYDALSEEVPITASADSSAWLIEDITREDTELRLRRAPPGTFLMRYSPAAHQYILSVRVIYPDHGCSRCWTGIGERAKADTENADHSKISTVHHIPVNKENKCYYLLLPHTFSSLTAMVECYKKNNFRKVVHRLSGTLGIPWKQIEFARAVRTIHPNKDHLPLLKHEVLYVTSRQGDMWKAWNGYEEGIISPENAVLESEEEVFSINN